MTATATAATATATLLLAWHDGHHDGAWFPLIPLLFVTLWITLFVTIGVRWRRGGSHGSSGESVLAERFARGEIDDAEYRRRRSVLRGKD